MMRAIFITFIVFAGLTCTAFAQDVTFTKIYYTAPTLKNAPEVVLTITDKQVEIIGKRSKEFGDLIIPFGSIDTIAYESAERHQLAEGARMMPIAPIAGALVTTLKTTNHWLDIHYRDATGPHTAILQLNVNVYPQILSTLQAKSGKEISRPDSNKFDQNLPSGGKDVDEVVAYSVGELIAAIKPAMGDVGCNVTVEKPDRIECKRPRGGSELTGVGGEKVVATFQARGEQTSVHIETDRGFNGHVMKKNWSTPIYNGMMDKVRQLAIPKV